MIDRDMFFLCLPRKLSKTVDGKTYECRWIRYNEVPVVRISRWYLFETLVPALSQSPLFRTYANLGLIDEDDDEWVDCALDPFMDFGFWKRIYTDWVEVPRE